MGRRTPRHSRYEASTSKPEGGRGKGQHKGAAAKTATFGSGNYWLYGAHACAAALANPDRQIRRIIATRAAAEGLFPEPHHPKPEIMEVKDFAATLNAGGGEAVHQGVALLVAPLETAYLDEVLRGDQPLLILDQVTDPHNLGAMLRSAAAFDAAAIIMTKDHSAPESAVVAKAASGALDIVPRVIVTNLASALREIQEAGYWVAGLDGEAKQTIREAKLHRKTALVMGAEGRGLRRLTAESCDILVRLPMSEQMESLNVSNAAAIALYSLFTGE